MGKWGIDIQRIIFSHGSSMDSTNVDSNHILRRQRNIPSFDFGGRVEVWSGFGGGSVEEDAVSIADGRTPTQVGSDF